jgi:hypothetical protein
MIFPASPVNLKPKTRAFKKVFSRDSAPIYALDFLCAFARDMIFGFAFL